MVEKQSKLLNLKELSDPIGKVDRTLIAVIAERMRLSRQVEAYKRQEGEPIVRYEVEDRRLAVIEEIAKEFGINPHFARGLLYFIIDESCKVQLIQLQEKGGIPDNLYEGDDEGWYRHLKQNLLELTALFAPIYDEHYGGEKTPFAVAMYRDYEKAVLQELMQDLPDNELCVDVGCATGSMSFFLADSFRRVVGYDLSPEMIEEAQRKLTPGKSSLSFSVADIETGVPVDDASASLVVLNMGTASEFRDSEFMMREVERILRPGGHVLLSFYNADALLYRLGFLPWPVGINAAVNLRRKSLEVHMKEKIFEVYARAYRAEEVEELFMGSMAMVDLMTCPTVTSLLPNDLFSDKGVQEAMSDIDKTLTSRSFGSYILAVGRKND